ncbi:MAG: hypothetical protein ACR2QJ_01070 [Geminicoccaceae bacterium]
MSACIERPLEQGEPGSGDHSTGLKVNVPGEWQRERFGERKNYKPCSAWRKPHLGIDPDDGEGRTHEQSSGWSPGPVGPRVVHLRC